MSYVPHTAAEQEQMLTAIGVSSIDDLFADIPAAARLNRPLSIPGPLSEMELMRRFSQLSQRNAGTDRYVCYIGAGAYDRFIPAVVDSITARGEFLTAYTPYQAETSQGTLQVIYEFQSLICALTGMDVANASLYDGASALGEAILMAVNVTGRRRALLAPTLHPYYSEVARSYTEPQEIECIQIAVPAADAGVCDADLSALDEGVAAVVVQQPNFLGLIEDPRRLVQRAHEVGALVIMVVDPISLGMLATPGSLSADVVVGEGQPLGVHLSYGGPYVGFMATKQAYVRRMPGRIVGRTTDADGRPGYVLTLQAREQHIRRAKATSNICTNEALVALANTIYLSALGPRGVANVALQSYHKAHYLADRLADVPGVTLSYRGRPFWDEFVVRLSRSAASVVDDMSQRHILAGFDLGNVTGAWGDRLLVAVTERRTREELDDYVQTLGEVLR